MARIASRPRYRYRLVRDNGATHVWPLHGNGVGYWTAAHALDDARTTPSAPPDIEVERFLPGPASALTRCLRCAACGEWTAWCIVDTKSSRHCGRRRCQRALMERALHGGATA